MYLIKQSVKSRQHQTAKLATGIKLCTSGLYWEDKGRQLSKLESWKGSPLWWSRAPLDTCRQFYCLGIVWTFHSVPWSTYFWHGKFSVYNYGTSTFPYFSSAYLSNGSIGEVWLWTGTQLSRYISTTKDKNVFLFSSNLLLPSRIMF